MRNILKIRYTAACAVIAAMTLAAPGCGDDIPSIDKPLPPETETPGGDGGNEGGGDDKPVTLTMVDPDATPETKALYSWLWKLQQTGFMFGHHDDLLYGHSWQYEEGGSDTRDVCGDYPAVVSMDFATMTDSRAGSASGADEDALRIKVIKEGFARGEVITCCLHINNPLTERPGGSWNAYPTGTSWDNTKVVDRILDDGSEMNLKFLTWLDRLAGVANSLTAEDGTLIPVILRPFHEHTQSWNWWGSSATTENEFIDLWRMTIRYLRDEKGVHNFIYAISPQMDGRESVDKLLYRWPGDEWVDFIGMDCYHGYGYANFEHNLAIMEEVSQAKLKPCGVTETGTETFSRTDYWTQGILAPLSDKRVGMVVMWRNEYGSDHYYSVWPGHPSEADFRQMHSSSRSIFSADLPDVYAAQAEGVAVL